MSRLFKYLANLRRSKAGSEDFFFNKRPRYVAIIMDGNSRWAARKRLPAIAGHREGGKALKRVVMAARKLGVKELTVYAFSTENWKRPTEEVEGLMSLFADRIEQETPELRENGVRLIFIGRREGISAQLKKKMEWAEDFTAENEAMTLYVAFNYGGRAEIEDAMRRALNNGSADSEPDPRLYMYAPEMHDPELLIRTSGEQRLSNFLLWQCAYSELYFSDKLWPDFGEEDLRLAFEEFGRRQRRFGVR
ncbi:MAG: di-trans,poly-cis-decaprenylcistransferase [Thermoleophilia bacterium]|nr:di-trans,poly-cis-decaprenylcistransferase [Thermoleophilia bacterium]